MKPALAIVFVLVVAGFVSAQQTINIKESIERIKKCYPATADMTVFNKCLLQFWIEVRPLLPKGIPELNIPKMDPFFVDKLDVADTGELVQGKASFRNVTVLGFGNYVPKNVLADIKTQTLAVEISLPKVDLDGHYNIDGEALLLPVKGDGTFYMNVTGIEAKAVAHIERHGTGLRLAKIDIDFSARNFSGRLNNLLGGEEVGEAINKIINDNSQDIFQDVKPLVTSKMSEAISQILTKSVQFLPPEAFILPEGFVAPEGVEIPADFIVPTPKP